MKDWRRERALVQAALTNPSGLQRLEERDWDDLLRLLRQARVMSRAACRIRSGGLWRMLPRRAANMLHAAENHVAHFRRNLAWSVDRLEWSTRRLDVPVIALKGAAYLLADLPFSGCRFSADIDVMVPRDRLTEMERHLRAHGWRPAELTPYDDAYYRRWTHELPPLRHQEWPLELDVHHGILPVTARARPDPGLLWAESRGVNGSRLRMLGPCDMTLHAIAHLFHDGHLADDLRQLVDIRDLMAHWSAAEPGFWDLFWPRAEALALARPAWYALRYAKVLLGAEVPGEVVEQSARLAPPAPVRLLMDRLVPLALFPQHLDHPSHRAGLARLLLYMRSHWLRMPPLLLGRHLAYKYYVRHLQRPLTRGSRGTA